MMYCNIYNATLTPWTDHFRSRSDDQCKGRLLFLCIASVQQLGPAPFRAPSSSIVTPDNYSSCPARAPGQKNAAMYVHKSSAQSKISESLHQHWLRSRISHIRTELVLKKKDGVIALLLPSSFPAEAWIVLSQAVRGRARPCTPGETCNWTLIAIVFNSATLGVFKCKGDKRSDLGSRDGQGRPFFSIRPVQSRLKYFHGDLRKLWW